jgi:alpha-L-fucosidase 2
LVTRKHLLSTLLLGVLAPVTLRESEAAAPLPANTDIDWAAFLRRNDMVWETLPHNWDTAPFLGNGNLGTILWQETNGTFYLEISRSDLYDHRRIGPGSSVLFSEYRLPNGHFILDFGATDRPTGTMRLDLWNAELRGTIQADGSRWELRCFVPSGSNVIVLELDGPAGTKPPRLTWHPDRARSSRSRGLPTGGVVAYPPQVQTQRDGVDVSVQSMPEDARYHTEGLNVGEYATAWTAVGDGHGKAVFLLGMDLSYPGTTAERKAVEIVQSAKKQGVARLEARHRSWWHAFYPKSFLTIPDGALESFYWIQIYKMGSASRKGGPLIDLMGPWYRTGSGWPAIWWNLNIQLTYWPFYMSNHLEEAEPLNDAVWNRRASLAANAAPYQADSLAIGRATGPSLTEKVGTEVGNLPWTLHNLWLYYRSSMDERFLAQRLFPLMKGAFHYLHHIAVLQPNGKLGLPATASPEYTDKVDNSSYTLACFRWLAGAILAADTRLKTSDPIVAECRTVLAQLVPYEVDEKTGVRVGKDVPFAHSHRHWSHLFMIYPFAEWDWANPQQRPLMEKSLQNWISMPQAFAGYSWLGAASMLASAGQGDKALEYLHSFLRRSPQPNTLYREGDPVIETPLACARTLQELLMTSHGDCIRIFPGVPSGWADCGFTDFRAEGAFLVSAFRRAGTTRFVRIHSLAGEPCRVRHGLTGTVQGRGKRRYTLQDREGGILEIDLRKDETITLTSGDSPTDLNIHPVGRVGAFQPWGANRSAVPDFLR